MAFSVLESCLTLATANILNVSFDDLRVFEDKIQSFDSRWKIFKLFGSMRTNDSELLGQLSEIARELDRLNLIRNDLIHGYWNNTARGAGLPTKAAKLRHKPSVKKLKAGAPGQMFGEHKYFDVSEIRRVSSDMLKLTHHITRFVGLLNSQGAVSPPPPSRRRSP